MTKWIFSGTILPDGGEGDLESGSGPAAQLPGRFALPGLVDAHCHLTVDHLTVDPDGSGPRLGDAELAAARLDASAAAGVGLVRDLGGASAITLGLRTTDGRPHVVAAGRFFAPSHRYFPRMHTPVDADDLLAAVATELDAGARWIKLIGDFPFVADDGAIRPKSLAPTYEPDLVAAVVGAAHARGARVAVHTNGDCVSALIAAGIDSVEHGGGLHRDGLEQLGHRGGAWTPTLGASIGNEPRSPGSHRRSAIVRELLPHAAAAGVQVLTGSDVVGSVAGEVALLVEHGLSVVSALTAASTRGQAYLRRDDVDVAADIVTYGRDPRLHPDTLAEPAAVVLRGTRVR